MDVEAPRADGEVGRVQNSAEGEEREPNAVRGTQPAPPSAPIDLIRLSPEEQAAVIELRQRDREVRAHEQAHASAGGSLTGAPQYEFKTGPDGGRYAVGGEVSVSFGKGNTTEETIRTANQARAAAQAPAEPSAQDLQVAAEASKLIQEARAEQEAKKSAEAEGVEAEGTREADTARDTNRAIDLYRDVIRRGNETIRDGSSPLLG